MRLLATLLLLTHLNLLAATTPLTKAIRMEKFAEAKKHLTPELVNKPDDGLYHPLTYAVYTGNTDLVEALLKAGANPNTVEHNGKTALYVAANLANPHAIRLLHKHGAKYPAPDNAYQPAKAAVIANAPETLQAIFTAYPNINPDLGWEKVGQYSYGKSGSPLNHCARHGYNKCGLLLLAKGCNTHAYQYRTNSRPNRGMSVKGKKALHNAAENPHCSQRTRTAPYSSSAHSSKPDAIPSSKSPPATCNLAHPSTSPPLPAPSTK